MAQKHTPTTEQVGLLPNFKFAVHLRDRTDIKPGYRTDHSRTTLYLTLGKLETRNKLSWTFNNSLLKDILVAKEINDVTGTVTEEYAALPYSREQLV